MISDTLIIGSGVIGLSLAWELAQRGERVAVVDSQHLAKGASWAGAGILPPTSGSSVDTYEQLRHLGHTLHPEWSERLKQNTGIDNQFQKCGGIYLARSPAETATLIGNQIWWDDHEIEYSKLETETLLRLEPALEEISQEVKAAWLLPGECQLRNPRHLKALIAACRAAGVTFHENKDVVEISETGSVCLAKSSSGESLEARQICICSGAWARQHLESLELDSGIMPIRGQMLLYDLKLPLLQHVINEGNRYLVCRQDGHLLAGSIEEEVGYNCETTAEGTAKLQEWAESLLPALRSRTIKNSWAGLRPGSFDGFPYLGRIPGKNKIFLAAGHFRSGLHLSCATAVCLADVMQGIKPPIDLHPFRVGRG